MTTEKAREVRRKGHEDAKEFARLIGKESDYQNNPKAKKDVFDLSGDTYSVKSGTKRWQLFLYGINRIKEDDFFQTMNGIGQLLIECINSFPLHFLDYTANKKVAKGKLRIPMRKLAELFQEKIRVRSFINKAMFDGGQVDYLSVKHNDIYHIFLNKDVVKVFTDVVEVSNSQARSIKETPEQKVIFKYNNLNLCELEIRNSGKNHYREVLFVMNKLKMMDLLFEKIPMTKKFNDKVLIYGNASRRFGRW